MKTKLYLGLGAFAAVAMALALASQGVRNAIAQETTDRPVLEQDRENLLQTTETREYGTRDTTVDRSKHAKHAKKGCRASELIGMNVRGASGVDDIGSIDDLMIGHDGRVKYAAVSFGGFLGIGDKLFAVPFDAIELVKNEDESYARIDVTEQRLENMEGFNQDNWPKHANKDFGGPRHRQAERPELDTDVDVQR